MSMGTWWSFTKALVGMFDRGATPSGAGCIARSNAAGLLPRAPDRETMRRAVARRTVENALRRRGFAHVAGADEAGRGALAGPGGGGGGWCSTPTGTSAAYAIPSF